MLGSFSAAASICAVLIVPEESRAILSPPSVPPAERVLPPFSALVLLAAKSQLFSIFIPAISVDEADDRERPFKTPCGAETIFTSIRPSAYSPFTTSADRRTGTAKSSAASTAAVIFHKLSFISDILSAAHPARGVVYGIKITLLHYFMEKILTAIYFTVSPANFPKL